MKNSNHLFPGLGVNLACLRDRPSLYCIAIQAGLYCKVVQVYHIPIITNEYSVSQCLYCSPYVTHVMKLQFSFTYLKNGSGWVRQWFHVSCFTGASNWDWLTVEQGLLSLQQVRVEGECFYFFFYFTFFHFPLSPLFQSFISSSISSISLPFFGRQHKMMFKDWHLLKPQHSKSIN